MNFEGLWESPKAFILSRLLKKEKVLVITSLLTEAKLIGDIPFFFQGPLLELPDWETLPGEKISPNPDIVGQRCETLLHMKDEGPLIVFATLQAALQPLLTPQKLKELTLLIEIQKPYSFETLIEKLQLLGYERRKMVQEKGEFSVRGGIIDIFPSSYPHPFRIEFFDEEVESIRIFDPLNQRSEKKEERVLLLPADEFQLEERGNLFDFFPKGYVVLDEPLHLERKGRELLELGGDSLMSYDHFLEKIDRYPTLIFSKGSLEHPLEHPFKSLWDVFKTEISSLDGETLETHFHLPEEGELVFLYETDSEKGRLKKLAKKSDFYKGYLSCGFALEKPFFACIPFSEISKRFKIRRQKQRTHHHTAPLELVQLKEGDFVVHLRHGIGKFLGIEKKTNHLGLQSEFLVLEYLENAKLYVPLDQTHLVSRYIGSKDEPPKLYPLGGNRWQKTKAQAEREIHDYASELLSLYAQRQVEEGFAFPQDNEEMLQFEEDFPYMETEDQLKAIAQIKVDMESSRPMDRLLLGDVGYGKTEVAMRAAFKAVQGGKQVAVLVPTTLLAQQHEETFKARCANFPVRVESLTRFKSAKEEKAILKQVAQGSLDILIGTHRLLSKDIFFKDLGLLIIDEEQRFGVKAKEHLKHFKVGVDCLTLSATPIPRTLYMSVVGAKDMSTLNTPPEDRLPVKTVVVEAHDDVIKTALLRELSRDGQAFIVHNRVETIFQYMDKIQKLVPHGRFVVGHGQMESDELDATFHLFKEGRADILVSTTIVENGIDIPRANTILVDRADRFGMADLYQLRGRVGRWNRKAYAYFLVPPRRVLSEIAQKRLDALIEAVGYGGGMKLAMRDLEIRGAGEILGVQQSGHISVIGFHLYCKLLKRTIEQLQGKPSKIFSDIKIEVPFDARLEESYVNEVSLRLELYNRLGEVSTQEEVEALFDEIVDRFGPLKKAAKWLYHLSRLKVFCAQNEIFHLVLNQEELSLKRRHKGKELPYKLKFQPSVKPEQFEKELLHLLKLVLKT